MLRWLRARETHGRAQTPAAERTDFGLLFSLPGDLALGRMNKEMTWSMQNGIIVIREVNRVDEPLWSPIKNGRMEFLFGIYYAENIPGYHLPEPHM